MEDREERLNLDMAIDEGIKGGSTSEAAIEDEEEVAEADNREEQEIYNEFLQDVRKEFFKVIPSAEERSVFDFDRVSSDVPSLLQKLENE